MQGEMYRATIHWHNKERSMSESCFLYESYGDFKERYDALCHKMETDIAEWGVTLQSVHPDIDSPPFTYTIGLTDLGWPELMIVGIAHEYAGYSLNYIVQEYLRENRIPQRGDVLKEFIVAGISLRIGTISSKNVLDWMCQAGYRQERVKGPIPKGLQIVWPDKRNVFPADIEFDLQFIERQPCLTADGVWDYEPENSSLSAQEFDVDILKGLAKERRSVI